MFRATVYIHRLFVPAAHFNKKFHFTLSSFQLWYLAASDTAARFFS